MFGVAPSYTVATVANPYIENSESCNFVTATSSGLKLGSTLPFSSFEVYSPLRPFCGVTTSTQEASSLGDFTISSSINMIANIKGGVIIDPSIIPEGFTILNFTTTASLLGGVYQGLQITLSGGSNLAAKLTMPQLAYPPYQALGAVTDIAVLHFDQKTGEVYYQSAASWVAGNTLKLTAVLSSGVYIFARVDRTLPVAIPVTVNSYLAFYNKLGTQTYTLDSDELTINANGTSDHNIALIKPGFLYPRPYGWRILYMIYITQDDVVGESNSVSLILSKRATPGAKWAFAAKSLKGDYWNFTTCTTVDSNTSNLSANWATSGYTNSFGLYALLEPTLSAANAIDSWFTVGIWLAVYVM
jgi:hypothetical protein